MDLFKDKTYEDMDEISQIVEPYEFIINDELSKFPDEILLDADCMFKILQYNSGRDHSSKSMRQVIQTEAARLDLEKLSKHSREQYSFVDEFFDLHIEEGTTFNASTKELNGEIKLTKKKIAYEDKEIDEMLITYMNKQFNNSLNKPSVMSKPRINEICDLFGIKDALSDRTARGKRNKLFAKYKELMSDRTLNIRDVELFKRFINWNIKYIRDSNLPAMSNITKIKIMMRSELPIYSIKEDEV